MDHLSRMLSEQAEEQVRTGFAAARTAQLNALAGWPENFLGSDAEHRWVELHHQEKHAGIFSLADALAALEHIRDEADGVDHPH